ncbi:hypothetical protein JRQ81_007922, partial [Phrynocephalus forsythii]
MDEINDKLRAGKKRLFCLRELCNPAIKQNANLEPKQSGMLFPFQSSIHPAKKQENVVYLAFLTLGATVVLFNLLVCVVIFYSVYYVVLCCCFTAFRLQMLDGLAPFDFKTTPSWIDPYYLVLLVSVEITYFISGLLFVLVVEEWVWDYAITVTVIHIMITSVARPSPKLASDFPRNPEPKKVDPAKMVTMVTKLVHYFHLSRRSGQYTMNHDNSKKPSGKPPYNRSGSQDSLDELSMDDYWKELENINETRGNNHEEQEVVVVKEPDEGELEEEWLKEAGLSNLFGEASGDSQESVVVLATLTRTQAAAVQKRVETVTQTMRKKNKQYQVPDVREIFKQQNESTGKESSSEHQFERTRESKEQAQEKGKE